MKVLSQATEVEGEATSASPSSLVSRNITIFGRRTSVRLEPEMWVALNDIADREKCSVHDICALVYVRKSKATSLTAAIRVFLMLYYRAAATEQGHMNAGHGDFDAMKRRARVPAEYDVYFKNKGKKKIAKTVDSGNDNMRATG